MDHVATELIALAELSGAGTWPATGWRDALEQLRTLAETLIGSDGRSAAELADLDLILERIDRAERVTYEALRTYLGYITV